MQAGVKNDVSRYRRAAAAAAAIADSDGGDDGVCEWSDVL